MRSPSRHDREGEAISLPTSRILTRALLLFWALWFSVVSASNAADALREAGLLRADWQFVSGNFTLVAESLSFYALSRSWAAVSFAVVLLFEVTASVLFWRAAMDRELRSPDAARRVLPPFFVGIALFCAFLVLDELLLLYRRFPDLETAHFAILSALLLSLLIVHVLGERARSG